MSESGPETTVNSIYVCPRCGRRANVLLTRTGFRVGLSIQDAGDGPPGKDLDVTIVPYDPLTHSEAQADFDAFKEVPHV
jgi:hypothetical protein